jgi:hypothetical protein
MGEDGSPGASNVNVNVENFAPVPLDIREAKNEPVVIIALMEVASD